jgi:RHS repeat-associated protein
VVTYTTDDRISEIRDARGTTCYDYDGVDRVMQIRMLGAVATATCAQSPTLRSVGYTYTSENQRASMTVTGGGTSFTQSYAYDSRDRLCRLSLTSDPISCDQVAPNSYSFTFDDEARRQTVTYPNGLQAITQLDPFYQIQDVTHLKNGQTIASYTYDVDLAGNRTRLEEADGSITTWAYDDAYRLNHETRVGSGSIPGSSWTRNYEYDAVGNRLTMTDGTGPAAAVTTYTYKTNGLDQLDTLTLPGGSQKSYTYDDRGNLLSDGTATYTYDARDLLSSVAVGAQTRHYTYDAFGRRTGQIVNGQTRTAVWDELSSFGDVIAEFGGTNGTTLDVSFVVNDGSVLAQQQAGQVQYLLKDAQGSTRAIADSNGIIGESYVYDAFGQLQASGATPQSHYLYTGQFFDSGTQLYDLRARSYDPATGRFLSRDTVYPSGDNVGELNRYGYVANNPVNAIDPSGHTAIVSYGMTHGTAEEQAKRKAAYINGVAPSMGADRIALYTQSVLSAVLDQLIVSTLDTILLDHIPSLMGLPTTGRFALKNTMTFGLGTVLHLDPKVSSQTKAFSLNRQKGGRNNWPNLSRQLGGGPLQGLIQTMVGGGFGIKVVFVNGEDNKGLFHKETQNHAEILIARWAIRKFQGPPTPHRVLDIATSRPACTPESGRPQRGTNSCLRVLPTLWLRYPLLFETTVFPSLLKN